MSSKGLSLIEVLVVIAIMVILASFAIPRITQYIRKYNVEKEIVTLFSDLSEQRLKSTDSGIPHGIRFIGDKSYTLVKFEDANYNLRVDGDEELIGEGNRTLKYSLSRKGGSLAGYIVLFDDRGMARNGNWGIGALTVFIDYPASTNCLVVSASRIKVGRWNEAEEKCVTK